MASVEDRKAAERWHMPTLLRLIADREISSIGDDYWYIYDDTAPQGHRVTDQVESLIERGYARAEGYYDVFITEAGTAFRAEIEQAIAENAATR